MINRNKYNLFILFVISFITIITGNATDNLIFEDDLSYNSQLEA